MLTAFFRTVILYVLIMICLRVLGKRQIGELEPSELVLTMMLSDLAAVPMQDFGIPLLSGVIPILILVALSVLLSQLSLHNLRFRELLCGAPSVLIENGVLQQEAMRKNRYTLDELLEELREQGYFDPADVKFAILETSGQLSVLPWSRTQPPSARQLGLDPEENPRLPTVLISDGRVLSKNLAACEKSDAWLEKTLRKNGCSSPAQVFLLILQKENEVFFVAKEAST